MSARPIAAGTVSFGLVAIPVKLFATIGGSTAIRFNQLHEKCGSRVKQQLYCPTCDEAVERTDLVKGYQFARDQYLLFSEEEMEKLTVKATHSIEICEFLPLSEVDPIYFEKSYFLGPDKGGERPYQLLAETLRDSDRAAVGQYAARGKQYLILVRPYENGLIMEQLHYPEEIRAFSDVPLGEAEIRPGELQLARQLVDQTASEEFNADSYEDQIKKTFSEMVEQKIAGHEIAAPPAETPKAQIIDLMDALKASLAVADEEESQRKPPKSSSRQPATRQRARKS